MTYLEVLGRSALIPLRSHKTPPTIYHAQLCCPPIYPLDLGHLLSLVRFLNSNTDSMSQNGNIFSLHYWTLREWWASGCSTQQILANADYELERDHRPLICSTALFLKAAALPLPTCPGWASLALSIYSKYISPPFGVGVLISGRMLLTI